MSVRVRAAAVRENGATTRVSVIGGAGDARSRPRRVHRPRAATEQHPLLPPAAVREEDGPDRGHGGGAHDPVPSPGAGRLLAAVELGGPARHHQKGVHAGLGEDHGRGEVPGILADQHPEPPERADERLQTRPRDEVPPLVEHPVRRQVELAVDAANLTALQKHRGVGDSPLTLAQRQAHEECDLPAGLQQRREHGRRRAAARAPGPRGRAGSPRGTARGRPRGGRRPVAPGPPSRGDARGCAGAGPGRWRSAPARSPVPPLSPRRPPRRV